MLRGTTSASRRRRQSRLLRRRRTVASRFTSRHHQVELASGDRDGPRSTPDR